MLCIAGNIPEAIEVDVTQIALGEGIRLTELALPEGAEISGLDDGQDQMVVSVNAPKAVEEDPIEVEGEEGEDGEDATEGEAGADDGSDTAESPDEGSEEN